MEAGGTWFARGTALRVVLSALVIVALAMLLWAGRTAVFVLFLGLLFGVYFSYFTGRLVELGVRRVPALLIVILVNIALLTGFGVLLWPPIRDQLVTVIEQLPVTAEGLIGWVESQYEGMVARVGEPDGLAERAREWFQDQTTAILAGALPVINTVFGAAVGLFAALGIGIYTAADPDLYRNGFVRLVPPQHRERVERTLDATGHTLRRWLLGTLINMVLVALLTGVGLWALGVPAVFALAAIAGAFEFIPYVGPVLAAVPAIALALAVSPTTALWVLLLFVVVQQIESNVITPLVMRGAVRLPPALTIAIQILMVLVFGFLGLLLAVPILAAAMVAVRTLYVEPMEEARGAPAAPGGEGGSAPISRPRPGQRPASPPSTRGAGYRPRSS